MDLAGQAGRADPLHAFLGVHLLLRPVQLQGDIMVSDVKGLIVEDEVNFLLIRESYDADVREGVGRHLRIHTVVLIYPPYIILSADEGMWMDPDREDIDVGPEGLMDELLVRVLCEI